MSQSAFTFWKDKDERATDTTQKHSNAQSPVLKSTQPSLSSKTCRSPVKPCLSSADSSRPLVSPASKVPSRNEHPPLRLHVSLPSPKSPSPRIIPPVSRSKGASLHVHTCLRVRATPFCPTSLLVQLLTSAYMCIAYHGP